MSSSDVPTQPDDDEVPEFDRAGIEPKRAEREWFTVVDTLIVLAKHKVLVFGFPLAAALLTGLVSFFIPPTYVATAKLLPPQQSQSAASAMLGQLGALAALGGVAGGSGGGGGGGGGGVLGIKNPNDVYVTMLKGRRVADALIERFGLQQVYGGKLMMDVRRSLDSATVVTVGKDGVISIEVGDREPKRAAAIANAYIDELYKLTQQFAVTEASQRRLFFERQLVQTKEGLANAELALRRIQEKTGVIKLEDQGRAIIESVSRMKGLVAAKEVQLTAMRMYLAEGSPEFKLAQQELGALRSQLAKLEQRENSVLGDVFVPTQRVPEVGLEYLRGFRDMRYHETLFEMLAKQFELAKIDEAKEAALIQVLEDAIEPERRSKPERRVLVMIAFVVALLIAIPTAFVREALAKARTDPALTERFAAVRENLRWR